MLTNVKILVNIDRSLYLCGYKILNKYIMEQNEIKETIESKLAKIVSKKPSSWLIKDKWRRENRIWLRYSGHIALKVLARMDEKNVSIEQLSKYLNLSIKDTENLFKGEENFTIKLISELERFLTFKIITI